MHSNARTNLNETDPKLHIIRLFADYKTFLRTQKWDPLLTDVPKIAIDQCVIYSKYMRSR